MRNLWTCLLILGFPILATASDALWSCEADHFYANPFFDRAPGRLQVEAGKARVTLARSEAGELRADLVMDNPEVPPQAGVGITTNSISAESIGEESYQTALGYIAQMLDRPDLLQSSSYKSYQLNLGEDQFSLVVLEMMEGEDLKARALLFPGYEVMGACEP